MVGAEKNFHKKIKIITKKNCGTKSVLSRSVPVGCEQGRPQGWADRAAAQGGRFLGAAIKFQGTVYFKL
jgi:hypothetical protein